MSRDAAVHPPFSRNVSVVVLNYDRVATTLQCLDALEAAASDLVAEVLVVDNGSPPEAVAELAAGAEGRARVLALGLNRYFGEGNNIGAEEATGDYLVFLNNDAFVQPGWLEELAATMAADPAVAAVGPMFVYPDGRVQEVGGVVLTTGDVVQVGKGAVWGPDHYTEACPVDFCSAACLLMRTADFHAVGGFSYEFEPAYYEDVDLCLKLWAARGAVMVNPRATVVHIESHTTSDRSLRLHSISEINRQKFVRRWGDWLRHRRLLGTAAEPLGPGLRGGVPAVGPDPLVDGRNAGAAAAEARRDFPRRVHGVETPQAVLYSPFELVPGGGERVLFELAGYLSGQLGPEQVALSRPHRYSTTRLSQLSRVFGFSRPVAHPRLFDYLVTGRVELGVVLGNAIVPPVPAFGRRSVYLCQFPFNVSDEHVAVHRQWLADFDEIWVYSDFVRRYVAGLADLHGLEHGPIRVIAPPGHLARGGRLGALVGPPHRADGGTLLLGGPRQTPGRGHRRHAGAGRAGHADVRPGGGRFAARHRRQPGPLPRAGRAGRGPELLLPPQRRPAGLAALYARSAVLVHAAGFGTDPLEFPERLEHFGITPVEAASFGCIPVCYREGGPAEVLSLLGCDTGFTTRDEAADVLASLWKDPEGSTALSAGLPLRSDQFSVDAFHQRVGAALRELAARP